MSERLRLCAGRLVRRLLLCGGWGRCVVEPDREAFLIVTRTSDGVPVIIRDVPRHR